ncbi:MAE_28990/MAE_18760 family HEPN-like nuclease [Peribacillus frigoritolerans]|uniref:MAE_28990/MAE_18760 family HEPN-like nuclease n=1 Tax=Peribacillus frigoritolerans TaxID=450367 RepID=UPI003816522D
MDILEIKETSTKLNSQEDEDYLSGDTYAALFIEDLEERWNEIDLLIDKIKIQEEQEFVNVLCRSAIVLLVAHLEGFMKEAASVIIKELNQQTSFSQIPKSFQKTYTTFFLNADVNGNVDHNKQKRLLEEFDKLNAKLLVDPFLFQQNKNPSPTIIEKVLYNFGVNDFFRLINKSKLDIVFENNPTEISGLLENLKKHIQSATLKYPYQIDLNLFDISIKEGKLKRKDSLWITFLDELLRLRNSIAHGSTFNNEITVPNLIDFKTKVHVLQYGIALVLFNSSVKK